MKQLTPEMAASYVGGQIEVRNPRENYVYRGEIAKATINTGGRYETLKFTLAWTARMTDRDRWVYTPDDSTYAVSLGIYEISDNGAGRIQLTSFHTGETARLFLPSDKSELLDRSEVENP